MTYFARIDHGLERRQYWNGTTLASFATAQPEGSVLNVLRPHLDHVTAPLAGEQQQRKSENRLRAKPLVLNELSNLINRPDMEAISLDRVIFDQLRGFS
jgi:hypothetical protein